MHPLPRVGEITEDVDDLPQAAFFREMENGMYTRMAIISLVTGTANDQQKVKVAIELENGDEEFYGVDGKIGKNQKFYLVAELDPNAATGVSGTIQWPAADKSNFPATGVTRVFIQDYTTTANFTINSLKNAYVTIPDLRASKLQLGLSVDLEWQTGLTYDVTID